ncbi:uncharacterized protein [Euphorbia lathyris]|uniref:uncharacterized protein n=1 Tax=Euphorbia lathyris TaxID=212925 RepID=UPI003313E9B0
MYRKTCFGQYLDIKVAGFSSGIVHHVLSREIKHKESKHREMWFRVRGVDMRFGDWEFSLISGLRFGVNMGEFMERMYELEMSHRLRNKYFKQYETITTINFLEGLQSIQWKKKDATDRFNQDAVMIAMLYFVHGNVLDNANDRYAKDWVLDLADYPRLFNEFPWGTLAWEETYRFLDWAISKRLMKLEANAAGKRKRVPYQLIGFAHVFQSWILELWNVTRAYYTRRSGNPLPRLLRWTQRIVPSNKVVRETFSVADPPDARLVVEKEEKEFDWYTYLVDHVEGREADIDEIFAQIKKGKEKVEDEEEESDEEEGGDEEGDGEKGHVEERGDDEEGGDDEDDEEGDDEVDRYIIASRSQTTEINQLQKVLTDVLDRHHRWCKGEFSKVGSKLGSLEDRVSLIGGDIKDLKAMGRPNTNRENEEAQPSIVREEVGMVQDEPSKDGKEQEAAVMVQEEFSKDGKEQEAAVMVQEESSKDGNVQKEGDEVIVVLDDSVPDEVVHLDDSVPEEVAQVGEVVHEVPKEVEPKLQQVQEVQKVVAIKGEDKGPTRGGKVPTRGGGRVRGRGRAGGKGKRVPMMSKYLNSPFTDPLQYTDPLALYGGQYIGGFEERPVICNVDDQRHRIDACLIEELDAWLNGPESTEGIRLGGLDMYLLDAKFFNTLRAVGTYICNEHITGWFYLLRRQSVQTEVDAEWTTVDTDFVGLMGQAMYVKGFNEPNWDSEDYFVQRVKGDTNNFVRPWHTVKRVFIPISYKQEHWILGVLELRSMHLHIYDSLISNMSEQPLDAFLQTPLQVIVRVMELSGYFVDGRENVRRMITWSRVPGVP